MTSPNHSVLLFFYGQSNADVFLSKPALNHPLERDPRILAPNDGWGVRGSMGRMQRTQITGFEPAYLHTENAQSIGVAAGVRLLHELAEEDRPNVIVRSGAKGGMRLDGLTHRERKQYGLLTDHRGMQSPLLTSFLETGAQIIRTAKAHGMPIKRVFIPFFHGESDAGLDRKEYADRLCDLISLVSNEFSALGVETTWLLAQPGGTSSEGSGNRWPNRLALFDVEDKFANAVLTIANYSYPMADNSHIGATGKALIGEKLGIAISELMSGQARSLPRPLSASFQNKSVDIKLSGDCGLALDRSEFPAAHSSDGFSTSLRSALIVQSSEIMSGNTVRLQLAGVLPRRDFQVHYAFSNLRQPDRYQSDGFPFGRGSLRTTRVKQSILIPGKNIYDWVPAFTVSVSK